MMKVRLLDYGIICVNLRKKKYNALNFYNGDAMTDEDYAGLKDSTMDRFNVVNESLSSLRSTS